MFLFTALTTSAPRPFLLKGRADGGPFGALSCLRCPWSRDSFLLEEEDEELGRSLLNG